MCYFHECFFIKTTTLIRKCINIKIQCILIHNTNVWHFIAHLCNQISLYRIEQLSIMVLKKLKRIVYKVERGI